MKFPLIVISILSLLVSSCKKDVPKITGNTPSSNFSFDIVRSPGGDTLPFTNTLYFKNLSVDAFSYYWDFGDGKNSVLASPTHIFEDGTSFLIKFTSIGKGGNTTSSKNITLDSPCDYNAFSILTGCSNRKWSVSPEAYDIKIFAVDGSPADSITAPSCMVDDQYTFTIAGTMIYDAKLKTYVQGNGPVPGSCQDPYKNATSFIMLKSASGNPKIILGGIAAGTTAFLGALYPVVDNTYEIISINEDDMVVQGIMTDGRKIQVKFNNASISIRSLRTLLTGGSRKTWKLDPTPGAAAITAGVETNTTKDYAGGPLAPCQLNDWYTFTVSDSIYANFNGDAMINDAPGSYNCGGLGNFSGTFSLGPVVGSGAGSAQIVLTTPGKQFVGMNVADKQFIGVNDNVANVYRIIDLTSTKMILRVGDGSGSVQTLKFVVK